MIVVDIMMNVKRCDKLSQYSRLSFIIRYVPNCRPNYMCINYADMKRDPTNHIRKIAELMEVDLSAEGRFVFLRSSL